MMPARIGCRWFHTGDVAQWTQGGRLQIIDRKKVMHLQYCFKLLPQDPPPGLLTQWRVQDDACF